MSMIKDTINAAADYFPMILRKQPPKFVTESGNAVYGMVAEFSETPKVFKAAKQIRDAGYSKWDVHTPFPIHDMEEAMDIKTTKLPLMAGGAAITGVLIAIGLQWGTSYYLYPTVVQGKPFEAWQPFVPIMFELGVLLTAFMCIFGMLALNGLPRWHHPLFSHERFLRVGNDRFFISIEANDPNFDPVKTKQLLEAAGGSDITLVEDGD
jgi:Alternative complex III, ActD subunit